MKKITLFFMLAVLANTSFSQEQQENLTPTPNYKLATKFSPRNLAKMVHSTTVKPHWLESGNRFWYQYKTSEGSNYYIVDADKRTKKKLFDNAKMAKWLTEITKDPYDAKHLPKFNFEFVDNDTAIRFKLTSNEEVEVVEEKNKKETDSTQTDSTKTKKKKKKAPKMEKKKYFLEYKLGSDGLTILENEKEKKEPWKKWANVSPDSTMVLFSKNHNLYWMDKENFLKVVENEKDTTIVENQWTTDGERYFGYGGSDKEESNPTKPADTTKREAIRGYWSHDSKKFVFARRDSRHIKDLWVINSVAKGRPELETYKYHMAGEPEFYKTSILIFDMPSKDVTRVQLDSTVQQTIGIYSHQYKKTDKSEHKPRLLLSEKDKIYLSTVSRDRKRLDIQVADINTGEVKTIIEDHFNTYVDKKNIVLLNNETEILHWSERDGWGHFYLYDANGKLKNQVTSGEFHVDDFKGIDENTRTVYFVATGVNKDEDPYYEHLYKVNLNGSGLKCLNEGDYNNSIDLSDSNLYFVNNYSRVNTTPKSELRNSNGSVILELEEADLSQLMAAGYKFPEPFKLKAADGITDLYGVMYKPYDFDETKKYPILEYVYPGPQTEAVNKSFSVSMHNTDRMAQVGFIVVTVGNRGGHPARSKWYHTYGYGNLRDYGLEDKKYVAEQLADKYNYIDIDKVGIYGHSGGGFMSTAAMLVYPDFFKVAVSSAGNHDNTIYNSWWSETHHGIKEVIGANDKISYKYNIDKNQSLVRNLKGKLMLVTGDIDNNVHPASTIRVADALIKANKRFDFMVMPGQRHGFGHMYEYFFWLKADYFSKYLLGVEVTDTDIKEMNIDVPRKY